MKERFTKYLLFISLIFFLCIICFCVSGEELHVGSGQTYSSIQDAVDAANATDTIIVHSGTYNENIVVNKTLIINGINGKNSTIINGNDALKQTIQITADNVQLYGFTIKNTIGVTQQKACIFINSVIGCTIRDNTITNGQDGIDATLSSSISIYNNTIENNKGIGIYMISSNDNQIYDNILRNHDMKGLYLQSSSNNSIHDNTISSNFDRGIYLLFSNNNTIYRNRFLDNTGGNAYENPSTNTWYYNSQGNYWDDYNGYDKSPKDGIGDTPYNIPESTDQDLYPLGYFIQENQAPDATIVSISPNPANVGDTIYFDGGSSYSGSIVNQEWRANGNIIATTEDFSSSSFSAGTYTITYTIHVVQDGELQSDTSEPVTLIINSVSNNPPSVTTMSILPTEATYGDTVYFSGAGTDSDSGDSVIGYEWTSNLDGFLYNGKSFTRNNLSIGTHTISFRVRDTKGAWSSPVNKSITISPELNFDNNPPTADVGGPYEGTANSTMTFDGSNSYDNDEDDFITKYYWDFGDGQTGEGKIVTHTYSEAGNYTVELTVTDNYGSQSKDTTLITITEEANGSDGNGDDNKIDEGNGKLVIPGFEIALTVIILIIILSFIMWLKR